MGDHMAKGEEMEKKAEKKINGWALFGSKYEDAADLYDKAANSYKLCKSCIIHYNPSFPLSLSLMLDWIRGDQILERENGKMFLFFFFSLRFSIHFFCFRVLTEILERVIYFYFSGFELKMSTFAGFPPFFSF